MSTVNTPSMIGERIAVSTSARPLTDSPGRRGRPRPMVCGSDPSRVGITLEGRASLRTAGPASTPITRWVILGFRAW